MITHISSCRNGAGYCILGFSCEVDKDFVQDDLGGHCKGLGEAFNPRASFVCCRENPALHPPKDIPPVKDQEDDNEDIVIESHTIVTETSVVTDMVTEIVTEIVTEVEPVTEVVTNVVTEVVTEEVMVPGTVEDLKKETSSSLPEVNCFAAILLGINCDFESKTPSQKAQRLEDEGQYVLISSSSQDPGDFKEFPKESQGQTTQVNAAVQLMVDSTMKTSGKLTIS